MNVLKRVGSVILIIISGWLIIGFIAAAITIPTSILFPTSDLQLIRVIAPITGLAFAVFHVRKMMRKGSFGGHWKVGEYS